MYQQGMKSKNLLGLNQEELIQFAVSLGEKPFRGKQLYQQIYRRKQFDVNNMTDLAKGFRSLLEATSNVRLPKVVKRVSSSDDTVKFLFELEDGQLIEAVFIPEESRSTVCISSQVGCDVGCTFCLTAKMGFRRNLRVGEIVGQILAIQEEGYLQRNGFNVVFMGMGEPLYNYKNVLEAVGLMTDLGGMDLSHRRITISTSGVVPILKKMSHESRLPNLAISLNAVTDEVRDRIMPINRRWGLRELLDTCRDFPLEPRRRITFEYVLLKGETDSEEDALQLARLLQGLPAKVNLIPYNPNPGLAHERPEPGVVERFKELLAAQRISSFIRKTRGDDIAAACGQLANLANSAAKVVRK
jgi:23S rRNA (adenine2503-C2)-methyltransferase